ncbi:MAG: hypothetical protein JNG85_14625 [Spirochaetaceae bacterium]|nr:hypothetical protein [Spirochaetaceae bacterium]
MMDSRRAIVRPLAMMMLASAMLSGGLPSGEPKPRQSLPRGRNPWDGVQLSKAERKGKTPEEIQAMRRAKYEAERARG